MSRGVDDSSALLAPYGGTMQTGAHKSVGSAPHCKDIVSMTHRRDTQCSDACERGVTSYDRTVPSAEGTLESSPDLGLTITSQP
eukprot:7290283-Prymnesium_polylepis.1